MSKGIWRAASPNIESAVAALSEAAPIRLPKAYLAQLLSSNGGEGSLGIEPGWISLWPAEVVLSLNNDYSIAEFLPGFFGFGSSGGGELLAFDARESEPYPIVMVPFIPMDPKQAVRIAYSFEELRDLIGKPYPETA
jgi:SMI1/KNR4 family protein SUKH-1